MADNATGAQNCGCAAASSGRRLNNVTVKDQVYYYQAKRNWIDSETYAFETGCDRANTIDRDRFSVRMIST